MSEVHKVVMTIPVASTTLSDKRRRSRIAKWLREKADEIDGAKASDYTDGRYISRLELTL